MGGELSVMTMIVIATVFASIGAYMTIAALIRKKAYTQRFEQYLMTEDRITNYTIERAHKEASELSILAGVFWPFAWPFIIFLPDPPTLKACRRETKAKRDEQELQALERAAGIKR